MEKTFLGLIIKILATFVAAWISFSLIANNVLLWIFVVAFAVGLVNFLIGDLLVLPRFGHMSATITNGILGVITAYLIDLLSVNFTITWVSGLVFLLVVTVFEYFLHRYITISERAPS